MIFLLLASVASPVSSQAGPTDAPPGTLIKVSLLWGAVEMVGDDETTVRIVSQPSQLSNDPTVIAETNDPVSVERIGDQIIIKQDTPEEGAFLSSLIQVRFPRDRSIVVEMLRGGEISLVGTRGDAEITNHNGSVRLDDVSGSLQVSAQNGAITGEISGPLQPSAAFNSLNGEIELTLPADAAFLARLRTDNGRLRSDFPFEIQERVTPLGQGAEVLVEINGGGAPLIATTRSGDVYLRRAADGGRQ